MTMTKRARALAVAGTAVACGWIITGCSVHASFGESSSVSKGTVETQVATTLAKQENLPVPAVACPGDLNGKVGTVMYCSLTPKGSTTSYPVQVKVDSASGTQAHFSIVVSTTAGRFTAPS